jgi:hypothetical protein
MPLLYRALCTLDQRGAVHEEEVANDLECFHLELVVAFIKAVSKKHQVLFCQSLRASASDSSERLEETYLIEETAETQTSQPAFPNQRIVGPHSRYNETVKHGNQVCI